MRSAARKLACFTFLFVGVSFCEFQSEGVWAQDPATPYIDAIRNDLRENDRKETQTSDESYTEAQKRKLKDEAEAPAGGSYSEALKQQLSAQPSPTPEGYTKEIKEGLADKETGGAIQAVQEGRSELKMKRSTDINHALGFKFGITPSRQISGPHTRGNFNTIYGSGFYPEFNLFYEYQPFHGEWLGSLGFIGSAGFTVQSGKGQFKVILPKPGGGEFPAESKTEFRFVTVPVLLGVNYRFNLLRYIRPFIQAGGVLTVYHEGRNDDGNPRRGNSRGLQFTGGVNFLLDFLSPDSSWDAYEDQGVKHTYLTIDYSRLTTVNGPVEFASSGVNAGFTFEF